MSVVGPFCGQSKTAFHVFTECITFTEALVQLHLQPDTITQSPVWEKIPAYIPFLPGTSSTNDQSRAVEEDVEEEKGELCLQELFLMLFPALGFIGGLMTRELSTMEYQLLECLTGEATLANGDRLQDGDGVLTVWKRSIRARLRLVGLK